MNPKTKSLTVAAVSASMLMLPVSARGQSCDWKDQSVSGSLLDCEAEGSACAASSGFERDSYVTCLGDQTPWGDYSDCDESPKIVGYDFFCEFNPNNEECYRVGITPQYEDAQSSAVNCYC